MAIRVGVHHKTVYSYDRPTDLSPHVFRLRPAPHCRTPIQAYALHISPKDHFINWQQDPFGNYLARVVFPEKTRELSVEVDLVAELTVINPFDFFVEEYAEMFPFRYDDQLEESLKPYLEIREKGPLLEAWLADVDRSEQKIVDFLVALNQRVQRDIAYEVRMEPGVQTCEETLSSARGSCRDSGWLLVQILRRFGLAARFVSGYLVQLTADVKSLDGPSGPENDFTDLHAWAEVYIPGAGWLGLDPTSGLFAGEGHIPLACTPDPASAAPVTGWTSPCETTFTFSNSVQRLHEDPRVTRPYTEHQWSAIMALGKQVDRDLEAGDVRLTMGGEPTFVSIDDMDGDAWNFTADSPEKRKLANELIRRLHTTFAPGGLLQYGQGKQYPGEPLPRWQLSCYWRPDGKPVWRNPALLADSAQDYDFGPEDARRFITTLTEHLGCDGAHILPAYEDVFYFLWLEGEVPDNVDPMKADLKDPLERRRLAELLDGDPAAPLGYVLPLFRDDGAARWQSSPWTFRRGRMFLIPGDSPMGLRLPLDAIPWAPPEKRAEICEQSQMETLPDLPDPASQAGDGNGASEEEADLVARTALGVEVRRGTIYIFLPPVSTLEDFLSLIAAVEATAEKTKMPVIIEGYEPPADYRIQRLKVTPDPGVIEVNIHPSAGWDELVRNTTELYEQARLSRLGAEKFMIDGRHTGTGGGNHVTLGGRTPADSPMLRRPELLRSLITYWQHHPSLSYLFSGMFIGPTSQAPRVDEGRDEILYELEIAFEQMPDGEVDQPWLADRLLRNLLVDLTGNTHRAEFCIDKLYSPDSMTGRLGLVEFRAFEMPPHARMSLAQMLLLRSLIARFWKTPYKHRLVRWGTELHDRFMLPYYVGVDMREVVEELQQAGYGFQQDWLDPFFEFRFPHYGTVHIADMTLELRMALEPWHVLGEEVSRAGTARFVDSSVERLQVRIQGLTDARYAVTCNNHRLPLRQTGTPGEYIAGVRYRAWDPPSALHPTIGIHTPLVFDIIDTWNSRSIGGCTYYAAHPGGRSYETIPVNAYEAEGRRIARFWDHGHTAGAIHIAPDLRRTSAFEPHGHTPGPMAVPPEESNDDFPSTLDLRR